MGSSADVCDFKSAVKCFLWTHSRHPPSEVKMFEPIEHFSDHRRYIINFCQQKAKLFTCCLELVKIRRFKAIL